MLDALNRREFVQTAAAGIAGASILGFEADALAHCDVPCGVYETDTMKWAVETILKLNGKIAALEQPKDFHEELEQKNFITRAITVKEEYAAICKREILLLWTDYFKTEHLEKYPDLHDIIWKAARQCSTVKRSVRIEDVQKLQEMVQTIAAIFAETKK